MKRILVTNLNKTTGGMVTFSLDAFIDEDVVRYKNIDFTGLDNNTAEETKVFELIVLICIYPSSQ